MAADGTQQLRAEALLVFRQQPHDGRDAVGDFDEQFGGGTGSERVQVLGATLEAEPIERVEEDHGSALQPRAR
jgi:hypothetical protein